MNLQAELVAAWIGTSTGLTGLATQCIKYRSLPVEEIIDSPENDDYFEYKNALVEWGSRDYWKRLWVVQEFLLAKNVQIICSDYELELDDLHSIHDYYHNIVDKETYQLVVMTAPQRRVNNGDAVKNDGYLLNIRLEMCYARECTDPRDRIFGIQGLLRHEDRLQVDYALSNIELYHQVLEILDKRLRYASQDMARIKRRVAVALEIH
jgi:hypothetical protein